MNDIIELYQKNIQEQIISKFKKKIQLRMKRIQNLNNILHQQINQYQKYITFIFTDTNYDTILNNTSIKNNFFQKNLFEKNQIFKLIQLTIIEINGLIFTLDKIEKTASIFSIKTKNESIFIPKSIFYEDEEYLIIEICQNAFHRSDHFKTITFSNDSELQIISKSAFSDSSITSLEIPASVIEIEKGWCHSTQFLCQISIKPNNKRYIYFNDEFILGKSDQNSNVYDILLFARRDIEKVMIPSFIKEISDFSFEYCLYIEKVDFSKNSELKIIGKCAFLSSSIESIIIPNHVTEIKSTAFYECEMLEKVQFEENSELQTIGSSAFECIPICDIIIPSQVKNIRSCAFANCIYLTNFEFEENSQLESIEVNAFAFDSIKTLSIPSEFVELKNGWCRETFEMNYVLLNPNNKRYTYYDDYLIGKSDLNSEIFDVLVFAPRNINYVKIPSFIKKIGQFAFDRCFNIYNADLSDNNQLELIDDCGFSSSSIEKVVIPDSVKEIGKRAFSDCQNLKYVILSNRSQLRKIKHAAFFVSALTSFVIPPNVTEIETESFSMCDNLQIIEISEDSKLPSLSKKIFNDDIFKILMIPVKLCNSLKLI